MANQPFSSGPRPQGRKNYNSSQNQVRKNERIRSREVRVIGPDAKQIGVMPTQEAIRLAQDYGLDLVEISATATPPVCRILDFGKYMYEQGKKQKESKGHTTKVKEVKFRVRIDQHDYITKMRHAEEFLHKGNKVKLTLSFRGREMEHTELGFETIRRAIDDLATMGHCDSEPRLAGRNLTVMITPLPANKRKLKFHVSEDEVGTHGTSHDDEDDED
jgi:translation initiation factor IF-3